VRGLLGPICQSTRHFQEGNVEIEFERTLDDLVEFNLFHMQHSPSTQRQMLITRIFEAISTMLLSLGLIYVVFQMLSFNSFLISITWGIVIFALYPFLSRINLVRRLRKLYNEGDNKAIFGHQSLTLSPEGIMSKNHATETKYNWMSIKKVAQNEKYIFLYTAATVAIVIPTLAFASETQRKEFLNYVFSHIQPT
jgi:hypothetical protein